MIDLNNLVFMTICSVHLQSLISSHILNFGRISLSAYRYKVHSAIMLRRGNLANRLPQLRLQNPPKQLQQNLKANLGDRGVISSLTQLIPYKRMLRPRELMEARGHTSFAHGGSDQVAAGRGNVGVFDAEDHGDFAVSERGKEGDRKSTRLNSSH